MKRQDTLFEIPESSKANHRIRMIAGARNNRRMDHDFYPTPEIATIKFLEHEKFKGEIWEPACGDGAISKVLQDSGYFTVSSDLIYRGYGEGGVDFLRSTYHTENIVTNPPFKLANKFVNHALTHASKKVCFLLRLNFLESKTRIPLFRDFPFARLYVHASRIPFQVSPGSGSNAIAFAWFVWDYSHKGDPVIKWI